MADPGLIQPSFALDSKALVVLIGPASNHDEHMLRNIESLLPQIKIAFRNKKIPNCPMSAEYLQVIPREVSFTKAVPTKSALVHG